jgi:hypothetical protein
MYIHINKVLHVERMRNISIVHYEIGGVLLVFLISNKTLAIALGNPH